ncbi:hypothetical protein [Thermococcus aciditolerans]|uniref:Uncharacterized protein n=1 Tax=Thermococcus aciditolerans TaxID=2598455 RepID=A0A5C0SL49_9EURY|nr:hypothetical protein [Thermococcus aciditolerans]QEK14752.1 hypothetical protein FPV09_06190 [Thermococcus aciditolerans]
MTPEEAMLSLGGTFFVFFIGLMSKIRANEAILNDILDRTSKIEKKLFDHEERLSRLEGKFNGVMRK